MNQKRWLDVSERWFRKLLRFYPIDFREAHGESMVETYRDRCRAAMRGGRLAVIGVWTGALFDALRNGPGEHARPAVVCIREFQPTRTRRESSGRPRLAAVSRHHSVSPPSVFVVEVRDGDGGTARGFLPQVNSI